VSYQPRARELRPRSTSRNVTSRASARTLRVPAAARRPMTGRVRGVYWLPWLVFIIAGLISTFVQRRYINALAEQRNGLLSDREYADRVLENPTSVISVTAGETGKRLRALLRRNRDPRIERLRLWSLITIGIALAAFAWIFFGNG
jgi:hypothetical protein